mgnify:CR=1 FL=1
MPQLKIVIVTPAAAKSRSGNRNTATRWARILRGLGCRVSIVTEWQGERADLMVALHALRSHVSLKAFRAAFPQKPAILALTGTDLYRDLPHSAAARESLTLASRMIVLQAAALTELSPAQRKKTHVIHQSEIAHHPWQPSRRNFRLCVLGHLREEKDPFRAALALRYLTDAPPLEIVQAGQALTPEMAEQAQRLMRAEPRYHWIGEVPHWRALRLLASSHAMIISSRMEGGAHVVSEAIAHGVPVIASDIPGNRGLLGDDYPGYYPVGDERELAKLIERVASDEKFLKKLRQAVMQRRPLFTPQREVEAWRVLLSEL